jgi:AcrR family transcriptional regulator
MVTRPRPASKPRRRTQEERRAATRAALLDATIECLVEYGYANTTLARIVERAGVSRGAQTYHFPTKSELVAEALAHVSRRQAREIFTRVERLPEGKDRFDAALDLVWEIHLGPLFQAALELFVAARTDRELRASLLAVERDIDRVIASGAARAFGEEASRPAFHNALELALAAMRGLALLTAARGEDRSDVEARWRATRALLPRVLG